MSKLNPAFERVLDRDEQLRREERSAAVLDAEREEAARTARCMGCGAPTRRFVSSGRGQYLCKDPECFKYYQQLWALANRAWKNFQQRERYKYGR